MTRIIVVVYPAENANKVKRFGAGEWDVSWEETNPLCHKFRDQCDLLRRYYPGVRIWEEFS